MVTLLLRLTLLASPPSPPYLTVGRPRPQGGGLQMGADRGTLHIMGCKAALVCQTKNNAAELAPSGIRVNGVNMGWCYTDNEDALQTRQNGGDSRWIDKADAGVPLKRIIRPADVTATVLFLLSDAAAMMSGGIIDLHPEYAAGMQGLAAVDSVDTR